MRKIQEIFERKASIDPVSGCWIWKRGFYPDGYPFIKCMNVSFRANRFSFMIYKGDISDGLFVCHTCDDIKCVNPDHLWLGTAKQNSVDMSSKNRSGRTKLTIDMKMNIITNYKSKTARDWAYLYGVSKHTIYDVMARHLRKHYCGIIE